MCLTAPARVLFVEGQAATVDLDGRRRRASLAIHPDVAAGDWVVVGAGTVLRRLEPAEARGLLAEIEAARAATAPRHADPVLDPTPPPGDLR